MKIQIGQEWRSKDPRDKGRIVKITGRSRSPGYWEADSHGRTSRGNPTIRRTRLRADTLLAKFELVVKH